jgi:hypothetical protein
MSSNWTNNNGDATATQPKDVSQPSDSTLPKNSPGVASAAVEAQTAATQLPGNTQINITDDVPGLPQQHFPSVTININDSYAGNGDGIMHFPAPAHPANNERTIQGDAWGNSGGAATTPPAGSDTTTPATTTPAGSDWNNGGATTTTTAGSDTTTTTTTAGSDTTASTTTTTGTGSDWNNGGAPTTTTAGSDAGAGGNQPGAPAAGSDSQYPPGAPPPPTITTQTPAEQQVINNLQAAVTAATAGNSQLSQTDMYLVGQDLQNMGYTLGNPLANLGSLTADQTTNVINQLGLNQTDSADPFNPSQLAYDARLFSHDEQANGAINNANGVAPSGEILVQTLLNGQNNGQGGTFQPDQTQNDWMYQALAWSMDPNTNQINGSFLADSMGLTYDQAAGGSNILSNLNSLPESTASLNTADVNTFFPDPTKPGGLQGVAMTSGWNQQQIVTDALFGHLNMNTPGAFTDANTSSFLNSALNDPAGDPIDWPLVNSSPTDINYTKSLLNSSSPSQSLLSEFLAGQAQQLGDPGLMNVTSGGANGGNGGYTGDGSGITINVGNGGGCGGWNTGNNGGAINIGNGAINGGGCGSWNTGNNGGGVINIGNGVINIGNGAGAGNPWGGTDSGGVININTNGADWNGNANGGTMGNGPDININIGPNGIDINISDGNYGGYGGVGGGGIGGAGGEIPTGNNGGGCGGWNTGNNGGGCGGWNTGNNGGGGAGGEVPTGANGGAGVGGGAPGGGAAEIAAVNQLINFNAGTDPNLNAQIMNSIDTLPQSTINAILQDQPDIEVVNGQGQNTGGDAAFFDPTNNQVVIYEGTGIEAEAAAHEMFHVQDLVDNITGGLAANPNPQAIAAANADIANMTPAQQAQLAQIEPILVDPPNISDTQGNQIGLGDIAAEIAAGVVDGQDQTGYGPELAQLFPDLTNYLEQEIG